MQTDFDPQVYGPALARLLNTDRRRPLGPGAPRAATLEALEALSPESMFAGAQLADRQMASCCVSAVWLLYDELDRSHTISQGIDSPSGSYWHAIMHRREGDFSNAKYWLRRVGHHPVFDRLGTRAAEWIAAHDGDDAGLLVAGGPWEPFAFVDLCQAVERGRSQAGELCLNLQQLEWELLFDFCYQAAGR